MTNTTPRLRDEALAWQAARPALERASRRGLSGILLSLFGSGGFGNAGTTAAARSRPTPRAT